VQFLTASLLALLVHEYGHLTVALLQGVHVKLLGWRSFKGAYIKRETSHSHLAEIMIAAAGPVANLLATLIPSANPWWVGVNLILALGNLLLINGSDGSRIYRHATAIVLTNRRLAAIGARGA
jgi:Zn-dependent protease